MGYVFGEVWPLLLAALLLGLIIGWLCRRCFAGAGTNTLTSTLAERDARLAELERELSTRDARVASLTGDLERAGAEAGTLRAASLELDGLRSRVSELEGEAAAGATAAARLATLDGETGDLRDQLARAAERAKALESDLSAANAAAAERGR